MKLDLVSNLSIKPAVSYGDHMHKHMNEMADFSQEKINNLIATTRRSSTAATCSLQEGEKKV